MNLYYITYDAKHVDGKLCQQYLVVDKIPSGKIKLTTTTFRGNAALFNDIKHARMICSVISRESEHFHKVRVVESRKPEDQNSPKIIVPNPVDSDSAASKAIDKLSSI